MNTTAFLKFLHCTSKKWEIYNQQAQEKIWSNITKLLWYVMSNCCTVVYQWAMDIPTVCSTAR